MLESKSQAGLCLHNQVPLYPIGMEFKDRLKRARKASKLTQQDVADLVNISPQAVSGWERGESVPETDNLAVVARALGKSVDWLLAGEQDVRSEDVAAGLESPDSRVLKVKGYVGAASEAHYYALAQGDLDEIEAHPNDGPHAAAVEIKGTSLGRFLNGWFVVYDDVRRPITDDLVGELCVVGLPDDRVLVKRIEKAGKGRYNLLSNDNQEPPITGVQIEWAAKVRLIRPK